MSFGSMVFLIKNFHKKEKRMTRMVLKNDEIHEWMIKISPGDWSTIYNYHRIFRAKGNM